MKEKAYLTKQKIMFNFREWKIKFKFLPGLKPGNGDNGEGAFPYGFDAEEEICPSADILSYE